MGRREKMTRERRELDRSDEEERGDDKRGYEEST